MAEDLQLIRHRKTIELQHDRGIERSDVAVPDVVCNPGEEDVGVPTLERARHWQLGNGMALPKIFAQEQRINPRSVAAHDHILIVVGKNLRLDEVARAEQLGDRACFMDRAQCPRTESFIVVDICSLQSFAGECGEFVAFPKTEMPCDIGALESGQGSHADVVELCEQKRIDEMASLDSKFWVIDCLLSNLQS